MTIQEAIKSRKHFRRTAWTAGDKPEYLLGTDFLQPYNSATAIGHDGYDIHRVASDGHLEMQTFVTLRVADILATDWEVNT